MPESILSIIEQIVVVELQWKSIPMDRNYEQFQQTYHEVIRDYRRNLIYALEGKHQAYPTRSVLYIGKTEADNKKKRPDETARARLYGKPRIMSCVYSDMTLRCAMIPDISSDEMHTWGMQEQEHETAIKVLERTLIHAMKPALNDKGADGYLPDKPLYRKLLICNKGDKGLLLPVVYGVFYARQQDWEPY